MTKIETYDYTVEFDDSKESKELIFNTLLEWFKKQEHFTGESLAQSDSTYTEAPDLLSKIAEHCFKFKVEWKD